MRPRPEVGTRPRPRRGDPRPARDRGAHAARSLESGLHLRGGGAGCGSGTAARRGGLSVVYRSALTCNNRETANRTEPSTPSTAVALLGTLPPDPRSRLNSHRRAIRSHAKLYSMCEFTAACPHLDASIITLPHRHRRQHCSPAVGRQKRLSGRSARASPGR